jgi:hypothetical protein
MNTLTLNDLNPVISSKDRTRLFLHLNIIIENRVTYGKRQYVRGNIINQIVITTRFLISNTIRIYECVNNP